jgi:hypothetical protein
VRLKIRLGAALVCCSALLFLAAFPLLAAQQEIASTQGPLTRIIVTDDLNCQVAHRDDIQFELFGGEAGACGTLLAVGGTVFGPLDIPAGGFGQTPWRQVSQSPVSGSGSTGDPFRITTVVDAGETGLRVQQIDSYAVGTQAYRTDITITNNSPQEQTGILYRAGDCYLQESDVGFGRVDNGAPACIVDPSLGQRIEQWTPITTGSHFIEGQFTDVWATIQSQQQFPDTCLCNEAVDNGAGLSWPVSVAAGQTITISHDTFFSPQGRGPVQEPFKDSVPDPTQISLDPVIIAQSVVVTAGVIVLVPFPSALFNSTLEENYDEVMAGVHRLRLWLAWQFAAFRAWIRRKLDERRARSQAAGQPTTVDPAAQPPTAVMAEPVAPSAPAEPTAPEPVVIAPGPATEARAEAAEPILARPLGAELGAEAVPRKDVWRTPLGILGFIALSALLYCFLDPTFGLNIGSLATFAGLAIGLAVVLLAYGVPLLVFSRSAKFQLVARALPITLVVGVVCVVVSRFANFQPGYLYGLVIGFFFASALSREQEGRAEAIAAGSSLVVALVAWVALSFLRAGQTGEPDLVTSTLQAATVTIVVAGLENAVFAMLPLRFLPGEAVYNWNRRVWLVLIAVGLFGFAHVLLNPSAGYLADTTRTSFFTLIVLLVGFGLASVLFWAYFRFRPQRPHPDAA